MSPQSQSIDRNRLKSENGFTLIETVMSIIILSLGIIAYGVTSESTVDNSIESPRRSVTTPIDQDLDNFIVEGDAADDSRNEHGIEDRNHNKAFGISMTEKPCDCYHDLWIELDWRYEDPQWTIGETQISI